MANRHRCAEISIQRRDGIVVATFEQKRHETSEKMTMKGGVNWRAKMGSEGRS